MKCDKQIQLRRPWLNWQFHDYRSWNQNDFSAGKNIHVSMCSKVVTGCIEVYVCGWSFRQKLPRHCFWRVLKDCARTSFRVIIYREFAYMAFYHKFCWPQGGATSICHRTPCSSPLVPSSFCLRSPRSLFVPITLGEITLSLLVALLSFIQLKKQHGEIKSSPRQKLIQGTTISSLIRASAGFCSWDGTTVDVQTDWCMKS